MSFVRCVHRILALISTLWKIQNSNLQQNFPVIDFGGDGVENLPHSSLFTVGSGLIESNHNRSGKSRLFGGPIDFLAHILLVKMKPILRIRLCQYSYIVEQLLVRWLWLLMPRDVNWLLLSLYASPEWAWLNPGEGVIQHPNVDPPPSTINHHPTQLTFHDFSWRLLRVAGGRPTLYYWAFSFGNKINVQGPVQRSSLPASRHRDLLPGACLILWILMSSIVDREWEWEWYVSGWMGSCEWIFYMLIRKFLVRTETTWQRPDTYVSDIPNSTI